MQVTVFPGRAAGAVNAPPSKSMAHRLLICAAMAKGVSRLCGMSRCQDVLATIDCLQALGVTCQWDGEDVIVHGADVCHACPTSHLYCRESGSTLRFLVPICWLSGCSVRLSGAPYLLQRPMNVYALLVR